MRDLQTLGEAEGPGFVLPKEEMASREVIEKTSPSSLQQEKKKKSNHLNEVGSN